MKRLQIKQKLVSKKFYVHEKVLRTRNCRRRFFKSLLPEKTQRKHVNQTTAIKIAIELTTILHNLHENINNNQHVANTFHKGDSHIFVSKDELIVIVSGTLFQILGAMYDTVPVPYLTVLGLLE